MGGVELSAAGSRQPGGAAPDEHSGTAPTATGSASPAKASLDTSDHGQDATEGAKAGDQQPGVGGVELSTAGLQQPGADGTADAAMSPLPATTQFVYCNTDYDGHYKAGAGGNP
jgi:hypothetical protein